VASGAGVKSVGFVSELSPDALGAQWMASRAWAEKNIDTVRAFRAAYEDAIAYIRQHPDEGRSIEKKWLGYNGKAFPSFSTEVKPSDFDFYSEMMVKLGLLKKPVDGAALILD
jgi:ABC-type nitrate/sulfonate/bicarbonate transport system substrate-binding protein